MQEEIDMIMEILDDSMKGSIDHLVKELGNIRAGKASPKMLSGISLDYYGSMTPLSQVSNVTAVDSKTIAIQPWEKSMLADIEQAIFKANLGLTPMNDGEMVRITIPALTEERRINLVKQIKSLGEDTKVSLRNARRDAMEGVKKAVKDGYSEDAGKRTEGNIQETTNEYGAKVNSLIESKEKDIMTI